MIRKMTTDDIYQVQNLEEKIFGQSLGVNFFYDELTINPFAHYYVLIEENMIIGYIGYRAYDSNVEVLNFLIDEKYQSIGFGTSLFSDSLKELSEFEIASLSLEVRRSNTKAINFYTKMGFKYSHVRTNYYGDEDALVYIKEVK